jgi:translation initiation factor 5
MPVLLTKIERKCNDQRTVVPPPPTYPTKFFGSELGTQTSVDETNDRYIVNGAHNATRLRELLDVFIEKFVLRGSCKNLEMDLIIIKNELIVCDCKAFGERTHVDMHHRLSTCFLKNPPKKKSKESKDRHAEGRTSSPSAEVNGAVGAGEDGELEPEGTTGNGDEMTKAY